MHFTTQRSIVDHAAAWAHISHTPVLAHVENNKQRFLKLVILTSEHDCIIDDVHYSIQIDRKESDAFVWIIT